MAATVTVVHGPGLCASWEVGINMYYRHTGVWNMAFDSYASSSTLKELDSSV